ncbi:MAG: holo-[acyl-carrier-protein] synthase [Candidatus Heimdallarchaeota archaeon]|nr:holo-[acyl-carrier-protein] synthase [Candidatus Heimdallarchaeota archaeon]
MNFQKEINNLVQNKSCLSIGIDMENVARFRNIGEKLTKTFIQKVFTKKEIEYCLDQNDPPQHFCARFCAKEALIKALAQIDIFIKLDKRIEIKIDDFGRPSISLNFNQDYIIKNNLDKFTIKASLSHTEDYAIAIVIL